MDEIAANEVIVAMKAKLKYERDQHFQELRDASTKANECVYWLDELDRQIRQQERFHPVEGSAPPQGKRE